MSQGTGIEWTDATWSPVTGCTAVSPGCARCYAAQLTATRLKHRPKYAGLAVLNGAGSGVFTGEVRLHEGELATPLRWRAPRRVFVNSMSDTFHKDVPDEFLDKMFAVMALCPQHTFQVLTKRPERMAEYLAGLTDPERLRTVMNSAVDGGAHRPGAYNLTSIARRGRGEMCRGRTRFLPPWPNVWLGTSCEDQARADERIPHLLRCPAAVRFLSCEPLLGGMDLTKVRDPECFPGCMYTDALRGLEVHEDDDNASIACKRVDWVIAGGESGKDPRPCNVDWIRSIVAQCKAAGVPCFVKQLGSVPVEDEARWRDRSDAGRTKLLSASKHRRAPEGTVAWHMEDGKGGEPAEWPEDLRVREFPGGVAGAAAPAQRRDPRLAPGAQKAVAP